MIRCDSCERPIEGARPPIYRDLRVSFDGRGRPVEQASTLTGGAQLDLRVYGDLHDTCVGARVDALFNLAHDTVLDGLVDRAVVGGQGPHR